MPRGRPSSFTPEVGKEICQRAIMRSLRQVCMDEDMPSEQTVYLWLKQFPEFFEEYARARNLRAYRRSEDIDEIAQEVRTGALDPAAARVAIDAVKWQASKEAPKVFGDKLELAGDEASPLTVVVRKFSDA